MEKLDIRCHSVHCGILQKMEDGHFQFEYSPTYQGPPVSLTMPVRQAPYVFEKFPAFFDGLLPEGIQLEALLRQNKIDANDYMQQLASVGEDLVGAVTVHSYAENNT